MTSQRALLGVVMAMTLGLGGCAPVLIGAGAVGGYAIGKDSVTDYFDKRPDHVFGKALKVAKEMGLVKVQDKENGLIKATIHDATVTITVTSITEKTVRLEVKARNKYMLPKVSVAQDIYAAINKEL